MTGATAAVLIVTALMLCGSAIAIAALLRGTNGRRPSSPDIDLEKSIRGLETRVKALETEWEDFYSKSRRALSRLGGEKRQQVDDRRSPEVESSPMTRAEVLRRARARRGGSDV